MLFRAQRKDGKGMVEGWYVYASHSDKHIIIEHLEHIGYGVLNSLDAWEIHRDTLSQQIGIDDKNGTPIYGACKDAPRGGDRIRASRNDVTIHGNVAFRKAAFRTESGRTINEYELIEIIGPVAKEQEN